MAVGTPTGTDQPCQQLCNVDVNQANEKKVNIIKNIVELTYFCRNPKLN